MREIIFLDKTKYTELVSLIDANITTFKNIALSQHRCNERLLCIRHDIDNGMLSNAVKFAKIENRHNLRSTYFVKYTSNYFDFSDKFLDRCKKIVDFGHDLGFHVDIVKLYMRLKKKNKKTNILNLIKKPLDFLRSAGLEVLGASAHGSPENYIYALNYEFWKEFDSEKNEGVGNLAFPNKISLSDVGLVYEAYFLGYDFYLSDSMSVWNGIDVRKRPIIPYENSIIYGGDNVGLNIINDFNNSCCGILHFLTHPSKRWRFV